MDRDDTPLIRKSEWQSASAWFYGVGAALALITILYLLLTLPWAEAPETPPTNAAEVGADG